MLPSWLQDCVKRMLVRDPSKRATAAEVLAHDWIKENGVAGDNEIEPEVLKRIRGFAGALLVQQRPLQSLWSAAAGSGTEQ
jgi:calcium-dependent protein kinase